MEAKIPSAVVVHLKARGFSLQVFAHVSMERVRSVTERCSLRRRRVVSRILCRFGTQFI